MEKAAHEQIAENNNTPAVLPYRLFIEEYSLFKMTGDLQGMSVLDLACGEGHYTRKIKESGATDVLGVDSSPEIINLAKERETLAPTGVRYVASDVVKLPKRDQFDMAIAMYLLNTVKTKAELVVLLRAIYDQLKPGAQFIGFNDNLSNTSNSDTSYRQYGFNKESTSYKKEGDPIHNSFYKEDGSAGKVNHYYLHPDTYAEAFREAGFVNFQRISPSLHPTERVNEYWNDFMIDPPIMGFVAYKEESFLRHKRSYVGWAVQNVWML